MRIRHLIWLSTLSLIVLVGIASLTGYRALMEAKQRLAPSNMPDTSVLQVQIEWQQQLLLVGQLQRAQPGSQNVAITLEQLSLSRARESDALDAMISGRQVAADLRGKLDPVLAGFHKNRDKLIANLQQNFTPDYPAFYQSANDLLNLGSYLVALQDKHKTAVKKINRTLDEAARQLIFIVVFSLVTALALLVIFYNKLLRPLAVTTNILHDLTTASSDLRLRLPEADNELGQLGVGFNQFLQQVQSLVAQLQNDTQALMLASSQITDSVNTSASGTGIQIQAINRIANALQKLSGALEDVGESAGRASEASGSAIDTTESGNHIVVMAELAVYQIAGEVEKAAVVLMDLLEESQQMRLTQAGVAHIAEQTNLLALAAAIETTRVRDPSRNLAPLVETLRLLAARIAETARSVDANIANLSRSSMRAVEVMSAAQKRVGIIKNRIANASLALSNIVAAVDQIKMSSQDIARVSSDEQEEMVTINKNMLNVLQLARRNYTAGAAAVRSREFLEQHLLKMNGLLQRFRT